MRENSDDPAMRSLFDRWESPEVDEAIANWKAEGILVWRGSSWIQLGSRVKVHEDGIREVIDAMMAYPTFTGWAVTTASNPEPLELQTLAEVHGVVMKHFDRA